MQMTFLLFQLLPVASCLFVKLLLSGEKKNQKQQQKQSDLKKFYLFLTVICEFPVQALIEIGKQHESALLQWELHLFFFF